MSEPPNDVTDDDQQVSRSLATALTGLLEKLFSASLVGPALSQIGLTIGDRVKLYRIENLIRLNEKLEKVIAERGMDREALADVALSVGLPLLERASYQDDEVLQEKWANLLASSMASGSQGEFSLDITFVEILHQFTRLDCDVLEYLVENTIKGISADHNGLVSTPLDPLTLRQEFTSSMANLAVEKLVTLGCAARVLRTPLRPQGDADGFGTLPQDLMVTMTGLNLYLAASGKQPSWQHKVVTEDD